MTVIRIDGNRGSGKTTLAKSLAEELGFEYIDVMTIVGPAINISTAEHHQRLPDEDPKLLLEFDAELEQYMHDRDNIVVDVRASPIFSCAFPYLNVILIVEENEGAHRTLVAEGNAESSTEEFEQRREETGFLEQAIKKLYQKTFSVDSYFSPEEPKIAINTTQLTPSEVLKEVVGYIDFMKSELAEESEE